MAKCQSYGHLGARDHGTKWSVWICMEAMLGATNKVLRYDLKTNNWPYITATLLFFWSKQITFYIITINSLSLYIFHFSHLHKIQVSINLLKVVTLKKVFKLRRYLME